MSNRSAESVVREYIERVWNRGEAGALEELSTPAYEYHLGDQPPRGRTAFLSFLALTRAAFPDWRVDIADVVSGTNAVAVRWAGEVTHAGDFHGIAPTDRRVRVSGINLYHVADGRVVAEWEQMDSLGLVQQLSGVSER